jgi:8-oxo-dGTP diphosphatase
MDSTKTKKPSDKHISVTCAIIERDGFVLAAQRNEAMSMPLKWEFPGGKVHDGESREDCLVREILEELNVLVNIRHPMAPVKYDYDVFSITLYPFICAIAGGEIILHEHRAIKWMTPAELPSLDWAEADIPVVSEYLKRLNR